MKNSSRNVGYVSRQLFAILAISNVCGLAGTAVAAGAGTTYDLRSQWVNGSNPNGPWVLVQGATPLPYIRSWTSPPKQPAYAPGPATDQHPGDYIPAWFKLVKGAQTSEDGHIILHTTDPANGAENGPGSVIFLVPRAGTATISGYEYPASFAVGGRPQAWRVLVNGVVEVSGTDPDNGTYSQQNPQTFRLKKITVNAGDMIELTIFQTSGLGTFMDTDLRVDIVP